MRRVVVVRLPWVLAATVVLTGACASGITRPVRPEYDLRDPSATRRLTAISTVERTGDRTQLPLLIERLDDDDESVRLAAGAALRSLTGRDTGYRASAPPEERRAQVAAWRAWWAGGPAPAPAPGASAPSAAPSGYTTKGRP